MLLFLVGVGVFLIVLSLVFTSSAFIFRRKIKAVRKPWYQDVYIIQRLYMVCVLGIAICAVLFLLKIMLLGLLALLMFFVLPILSVGLAIYGLVLARREKVV
jgi:hypothetical protein